jgi:hypothetical protein
VWGELVSISLQLPSIPRSILIKDNDSSGLLIEKRERRIKKKQKKGKRKKKK